MESNSLSIINFLQKNWETISKAYKSADESLKLNLRSAYANYLTNSAEKHSKGKSFFIRQPTYIYNYYVPISIRIGNKQIHKPGISSCTNINRRIVIAGSGGSGKSVLLKHLFVDCINSGSFVPILIELRDLNHQDSNLEKLIIENLETYGLNVESKYFETSKKDGTFCFFLDGYDEVTHSKRAKLTRDIKKLSSKYPKCPMIISSRPEESILGIEDFGVFSIMPLTLDLAIELVEKLDFDSEIKIKFSTELRNSLFETHQSFLSNPLLLSIMLLTYRENAKIPTKLSVFYNQAFEALFTRHDSYKGGYSRDFLTKLDILDFSRVFSLFCLQTYEKGEFGASKTEFLGYISKAQKASGLTFDPESFLSDCLNAVCLLMEDGLEVAFSHRSFQEYFVAVHISQAAPDIQETLIQRYRQRMRSDLVIELLQEINPDLVERALILPCLERLFERIGVKNKIGITHAAKIFKEHYRSLTITHEHIMATFSSPDANDIDVLRHAMHHYGNYTFMTREELQELTKSMINRYSADSESTISIGDRDLHIRNEYFRELLLGKGGFSVSYYNTALELYKSLKAKHDRRLESLDDLLQ